MKKSIVVAITSLGLVAVSSPLLAQQEAPQSPQAMEQTRVSEPEVRKFAEVYVEIEKARSELSQEMAEATTEQEAQDIQTRMQDEMVSAIEDSGWSMAEYNQIAQTINDDPELREKAISHIRNMTTS